MNSKLEEESEKIFHTLFSAVFSRYRQKRESEKVFHRLSLADSVVWWDLHEFRRLKSREVDAADAR